MGAEPARGTTPRPAASAAGSAPSAGRRAVASGTVAGVLHLLAKAVRQFRTYPPTSGACLDAIAACHHALCLHEGIDRIVVRVTPRELLVGDVGVGAGTVVEQELARRLHRVHVASITVARAAEPRHLSRFCVDLIQVSESRSSSESTLAEVLVEHGVDAIVADMAPRPEVFSLGAPSASLHDLAARERERRGVPGAGAGPATHLYPRDKGWIRLDPTSTLDTVSLVDLAVLVESPVELADILMRLTGDEPSGPRSAESALEKKFSEVAKLFAALDPRLAAVMFARLAGAVLNLEPDRRKALLERTILPGLLDGKVDGQVLKDFPDVNLAESLCLLLDLETAAPEVLSTALDRLDLPNERRKVVVPLLDDHLDARRTGATSLPPVGAASSVDRRTYELIRVDATGGKAFADFMAFDLSMDGQAKAAVAGICEEVCTTDLSTVRLGCLWQLVRLEPNPGRVERLLARALAVVAEFERAGRWADLARWIVDERALADQLASARPDVASAIASSLDGFCTPARVRALAELHQGGGEAAEAAGALVRALGGALVPVSLALLDDPHAASLARPLVNLLAAHAARLAPDLAVRAGQAGVTSGRAIARLLGLAGRGYEKTLAPLLASPDEETGREALRALVRIGTPQAAAMVVTQIQTTDPSMQAAAEEALAQFPAAVVRTKLRDLIGRRDFVVRHPDLGARLLAHAVRVGAVNLEPALRALAPLRFRFWNPPLVRVGRAARDLLAA